ncbi:MAG: hypothetical protein RIQ41_481 [Candidatus Parcubacteria bacterium]
MLDVGQANELKMAFRRAGYKASEVKSLVKGNILAQVREVLLGRAQIVSIEMGVLPVAQAARNTFMVPTGLTLAERITAGNYRWANSDITEKRFPHDPTTIGEWEWDLVGYDRTISSEDAKAALEVDGWNAASWEHELAFGAAFPETQRKSPIIALGSVCCVRGRPCVLGLWDVLGVRHVSLDYWDDGGWDTGYRFLRVRKVGSSAA